MGAPRSAYTNYTGTQLTWGVKSWIAWKWVRACKECHSEIQYYRNYPPGALHVVPTTHAIHPRAQQLPCWWAMPTCKSLEHDLAPLIHRQLMMEQTHHTLHKAPTTQGPVGNFRSWHTHAATVSQMILNTDVFEHHEIPHQPGPKMWHSLEKWAVCGVIVNTTLVSSDHLHSANHTTRVITFQAIFTLSQVVTNTKHTQWTSNLLQSQIYSPEWLTIINFHCWHASWKLEKHTQHLENASYVHQCKLTFVTFPLQKLIMKVLPPVISNRNYLCKDQLLPCMMHYIEWPLAAFPSTRTLSSIKSWSSMPPHMAFTINSPHSRQFALMTHITTKCLIYK